MSAREPAMTVGWLDLAASWNDLIQRADRRRLSDGDGDRIGAQP